MAEFFRKTFHDLGKHGHHGTAFVAADFLHVMIQLAALAGVQFWTTGPSVLKKWLGMYTPPAVMVPPSMLPASMTDVLAPARAA